MAGQELERDRAIADVAPHGWFLARLPQPLPAEGGPNDCHVLNARKVQFVKYIAGVAITLWSERPLSPDDVTDLIEMVVDELDEHGFDADVSSAGAGDSFDMTVEVIVEDDTVAEFQRGVGSIFQALARAGVNLHTKNVQTTIRELEPA